MAPKYNTRNMIAAIVTAVLAVSCADAAEASRSLKSMATDCVSLSSSATAWDAVTRCTDVYAAFTNGDARILEDTTASIMATTTTATVASLEECATNCFKTKKCQWFKLSGSKTCTFYQHLAISKRATALSASTSQYGFVLSADPDFLNQNINTPSSSTAGTVYQLGGVSLYKTTDLATSKAISMYISSATDKCAAGPLTLFRAFANNYQTSSMVAKAASGETINSMDAQFTLDKFLAATAKTKTTTSSIQVATDAVDITSKGDVVRTGARGATFNFQLDSFGRVAEVSTTMNYTSVLKKAGRPSANAAGTSIRAQYCNNAYQARFNLIHSLADATSNGLPFQAGHLVGCQFSNPSGFFNFVPQSVNSNANNGCWYNSELGTSRLLKMGCEGKYQARMSYFSEPGVISQDAWQPFTGPLMTPVQAAAMYTTATSTSSTSNSRLVVQRPCGFFHRPVKMSFDFTITSATPGTRCSLVQEILSDQGGKFFATDAATATVRITRAFAQWMYETNSFYRVRGLGAADWRANQCYAETGKLAPAMVFANELDRTFLKVKTAVPTTETSATCLSVASASSGVLVVGKCSTTTKLSRWSASAAGATMTLRPSGTATCLALATATAPCLPVVFQYIQPTVTFSGTSANIASGDNLVDGYVVADAKCLAIGSTGGLSFVSMATSSASCTVFQATYTLDTDGIEADD